MMECASTMKTRSKNVLARIDIFDSYVCPKAVDLTSLGQTEVSFGRDAGNDIVLRSHLASRRHGKITYINEQWCVTDLGSTNGIIYHDSEISETKVDKDDFIRIDDGVETIPDGVLILFASDEYSDIWESVLSGEWDSEYNLNRISPTINATIERSGDLFYLNVRKANLYINKRTVTGRVVLHEKDVLACDGFRLVFTSTALYINRLISASAAIPSPVVQEVPFLNNVVDAENDIRVNEPQDESSEEIQSHSLTATKQEPSLFNEPVCHNSTHQNSRHDSNNQNSYSTTSGGSGLRGFLASVAGYYVLSLAIAIIIWGIAVALWTSQGELALIVILACAIFGWQALNRIQPAMFIWMSWTGWIIYFCIKFILSAMIGLFVAPFKIGKAIAGIISGSMV